jgi:hypothetical protein
MAYITLRGRWCDIIVQNVHEPTEDKCDDTKDSFYEELEQWFSTYGSRPKIGLRGTSRWVANILSKSFYFCILDEPQLINAKASGKENNIEISLHMKSLSCTYLTS